MPLFEYACPAQHRAELLRKFADRDAAHACHVCGGAAIRVFSAPHCLPDGVYSYAPNVGDPAAFERRVEAIKSGAKVIRKEAPPDNRASHRDP